MSVLLESDDGNVAAVAHIQPPDGVPDPVGRHRNLIHGVAAVQFNVVQQVVGTVTDGGPFCHLLFGVDHLVGAVAQKEPGLYVPRRPGHHHSGAQLLEKRGSFQRTLEIVADGHDADVVVAHAQRYQKSGVGAAAHQRVGHIGHDRLDAVLPAVHSHNLVPQLIELDGNMSAKSSQTNQENGFHGKYPFLPPFLPAARTVRPRRGAFFSAAGGKPTRFPPPSQYFIIRQNRLRG